MSFNSKPKSTELGINRITNENVQYWHHIGREQRREKLKYYSSGLNFKLPMAIHKIG